MTTAVQLASKTGPSVQTVISGSTYIECFGCYYNTSDSKYYSVDANSNTVILKTATTFSVKFYTSVTENTELPATPASETILDSTDFVVKSAGSNILVASVVGSGGGGGGGGSTAPFSDGSAASPIINFTSDTNIGFYRVSSGNFGLSLGGTKYLNISATQLDWSGDNIASTNFAQFSILGSTTSTKYLTFGLNTTSNYGMIEAGNDGTGYYDLVFCEHNSSNLLFGTTSNTYSTKVFVSGAIGTNAGLILKQGTLGSLSLNFTSATTSGLYYGSGEVRLAESGTDCLQISNTTAKTDLSVKLRSTNANTIELKASGTLSASYSITFPSDDAAASTCLQNDGTGLCAWVDPYVHLFGSGVGTTNITAAGTTISNDMYTAVLNITGTGTLNTSNCRLYVSDRIVISKSGDSIYSTPNSGGGTGAAATTGGTAGVAITALSFGLASAGSTGGAGSTTAGVQGAAVGAATGIGGNSGASGAGGLGSSGAGGISRAGTTVAQVKHFNITRLPNRTANAGGGNGAPGGGGGGGNGTVAGSGGGGGGGGGHIVMIYARLIEFTGTYTGTIIRSTGGAGGAGGNSVTANCGAGGGGGGGGGGMVMVVCGDIIGTPPSGWITSTGGAGGAGGNIVAGTGVAGTGGTGGSCGSILYICLSRGVTFTVTASSTLGSAGGAPSGTTGGSGGAGGIGTIGSVF
jgi:hypothetical protein